MKTKICTYCRKSKTIISFNIRKYKNGSVGRRSYCKKCGNVAAINWRRTHPKKAKIWYRRKHLKKFFNLTLEQYDQMLTEQDNRCGICKRHRNKFQVNFAVDHNHKTEKIRGLLCTSCNTGLGSLGNTKTLKSAIQYLNNYD